MIKKIRLIDMENQTILYDGLAHINPLKNNGIEYNFENEDRKYTWKVWEKGMVIRSEADYILELTLRFNCMTKGHVETEFGILDLQCKTSLYKIDKNCIEIQYMLNNDEEQVFHFILEIDKEEHYVIH